MPQAAQGRPGLGPRWRDSLRRSGSGTGGPAWLPRAGTRRGAYGSGFARVGVHPEAVCVARESDAIPRRAEGGEGVLRPTFSLGGIGWGLALREVDGIGRAGHGALCDVGGWAAEDPQAAPAVHGRPVGAVRVCGADPSADLRLGYRPQNPPERPERRRAAAP